MNYFTVYLWQMASELEYSQSKSINETISQNRCNAFNPVIEVSKILSTI